MPSTDRDPTFVGRVRKVMGSQVTVDLDRGLAGITPIYKGQLQSIGQVGTLVRIPQGIIDLIATVTLVGISESIDEADLGSRWLELHLLGQVNRSTGLFTRGVGTYPGLDDPVHFALVEDLETLFPHIDGKHVRVGRLASSDQIDVSLDLSKLVVRHAAIVGSTGAGKTSAVASIVQQIAGGQWPSANVVVIDPHGEYSKALGANASVRSVLASGDAQLRVPYWALPARDILRAFVGAGAQPGPSTLKEFSNLVALERQKFVDGATWLALDLSAVTSDTPVPFDLFAVWHQLDFQNRETRTIKADPSTVALINKNAGNASTLSPAEFVPNGPGGAAPHQAPNYGVHGSTPELLRLGLLDPRLQFLLGAPGSVAGPDPLPATIDSWLGSDRAVSVLDFNGVPSEAAELAIGVIMSLLFEVAVRTLQDEAGIGRPRPVLVVLEEAHRYVGDHAAQLARDSTNRIAREGRKYGIGIVLVTQRPSELPDTALAQCGTLIALRLSNSADQAKIRHALPDSVSGLAEALPSLRTGEAIISGEALLLPTRVLINEPNPRPMAEDPSIESWTKPATVPDTTSAIARWRGIYEDTP